MPEAATTDVVDMRPWISHYPEGIDWNAAIETTPVHQMVLDACARTPDAVALDFLGAETRFGDLAKSVRAFAGALQAEYGVKKGTRVALLLPNTPFFVIAYYGTLLAGGTVVNCNPLYTVKELGHIVGNSGAELVVTLDLKQVFDKAEALVADGHAKRLVVCHFPDALPTVKKWLYKIAKGKDLANVRASRIAPACGDFAELVGRKHSPKPVSIDPHRDVAVQQYTGGTTGIPKGAMLSHANIAANVSQIDIWALGMFNPPNRVVAVLPFFHIFAMTTCMNLPLSHGTPVMMLPRFELKALLDLIFRTRATVLLAVPTLLAAIAKSNPKPELIASLKLAVSGGAPLTNETRESFSKISDILLAEGYGLTEASPVVCCAALKKASKPLSIGLPLPGTDVRMVDVDTGEVVPPGKRGELQVKGPQVMMGYFGNPEADADAFMDGWLRTGDVAYMDPEGYVFIVDRIKDMIISSGFKVYPRTIEEALSEHPAVEENNVIGVPDGDRGEAPVAFVKLKSGATVTESELRGYLSERLNRLEVPKTIVFKDSLPKTLVGKLSKKELREEWKQQQEKRREPA